MPHLPRTLESQSFTATDSCQRLLTLASTALHQLKSAQESLSLGRIRGTGPGVHFGDLIAALEREYPLTLQYPFEDSKHVGGAVWDCPTILKDSSVDSAITKIKWNKGADDLPMHVHDHTDRFIVVLEGRGFFHWTDQPFEDFDAKAINTIAARDRDVFVFRRGVVHTFSTVEHSMTLLSIQCPFIPFDDSRQFRLPEHRWCMGTDGHKPVAQVLCELHRPVSVHRV